VADSDDLPTRFELAIPGSGATFQLAEGKSLKFARQTDAQTMKIDALAQHDGSVQQLC
jgi:hypothetical protein